MNSLLRESGHTDYQILLLLQKHNGHGCTIKELFEIAQEEMPRYFAYTTDTERKKLYARIWNSINRLEQDRKLIRTELTIEGRTRVRRIYLEKDVVMQDDNQKEKKATDNRTYGQLTCPECHLTISASYAGSRRCVRCHP
jgi:hypothetical protein